MALSGESKNETRGRTGSSKRCLSSALLSKRAEQRLSSSRSCAPLNSSQKANSDLQRRAVGFLQRLVPHFNPKMMGQRREVFLFGLDTQHGRQFPVYRYHNAGGCPHGCLAVTLSSARRHQSLSGWSCRDGGNSRTALAPTRVGVHVLLRRYNSVGFALWYTSRTVLRTRRDESAAPPPGVPPLVVGLVGHNWDVRSH
jgi:hypothetical protein